MRRIFRPASLRLTLVLVSMACSSSTAGTGLSSTDAPVLTSIQPANAMSGVDPAAPVVLHFSHTMMAGMEMLVVLHEGSVQGTAISATATWSTDRSTLTLMPLVSLKRGTSYVVHLAPGLKDVSGHMINFAPSDAPGSAMGGRMVTGAMMGSNTMMNGQWGPSMMGTGWQASNGTFGMMYTFTTA